MVLSNFLFWLLGHNLGLVSYAAGILTEEFVFFLFILAGTGTVKLWIVVLFGFLGIMTHDILFYFLSNAGFVKKLKRKIKISKKNKKLMHSIMKFGQRDYFLTLLFSKFIYGTRVGVILYASHMEKKFKRFFFLNTLAIIVWLAIMIPAGWLLGQGFTQFFRIIKGLERLLLATFIVIIVFVLFRKLISRALYGVPDKAKNRNISS